MLEMSNEIFGTCARVWRTALGVGRRRSQATGYTPKTVSSMTLSRRSAPLVCGRAFIGATKLTTRSCMKIWACREE